MTSPSMPADSGASTMTEKPKPVWWPLQVSCGMEMLEELDTIRELLDSKGLKISRSSLVYNIVNDALPDITQKILEGSFSHAGWLKAPGMEPRARPGRPNKYAGRFKGKRREIKVKEVHNADVA